MPATAERGGVAASNALQSVQDAATFAALYDFKVAPDAGLPLAPLLNVNGVLYGTTSQGGTANANGNGTVYKITPAGKESVVYSFQGPPDGQFPQAGLIDVNGSLYGTTASGGLTTSDGTVFKITPSGMESVLYRFKGNPDGQGPEGSLVALNGAFYGTTILGGNGACASGLGCGTVFKVTASGKETVLQAFQSGADGQAPSAGLINVNGTLYGTTFLGGGSGCNFRGCGIVFKITPAGAESIVYSFKGGSDGANPSAALLNVNGTLYGTTSSGGPSGNGTVFKLTLAGTETVLHRFKSGTDGADPEAGVIFVNGALYGTTFAGGTSTLGTVYKLTTSGAETVLHSFTGHADGANPSANLIDVNGRLYGTAKTGGVANNGSVFSLKP